MFGKSFDKKTKTKQKMAQEIQEKIKDSTVCYVLITCQESDSFGNMAVELSYEGDPDLASYLLATAYKQGKMS